jgi:RNA binding exosome subunit
MSAKPPIAYIDIRVFAHATEDPVKVQTAVRNIFPLELAENLVFEITSCTGHHGNLITLFTAKLEDKKRIPNAIEKIGFGLASLDKVELGQNIKMHLEKGNLYLRFDKQSAFLGELKFSQNDPIRLKIHFKNKTQQEILEFSKLTGLLP